MTGSVLLVEGVALSCELSANVDEVADVDVDDVDVTVSDAWACRIVDVVYVVDVI